MKEEGQNCLKFRPRGLYTLHFQENNIIFLFEICMDCILILEDNILFRDVNSMCVIPCCSSRNIGEISDF